MKKRFIAASALALSVAGTAGADDVINDDLIVTRSACIGPSCADGEAFPTFFQLKLKSMTPTLVFEDSTADLADWRIQANTGNVEGIYLRNEETNETPFTVLGGAPTNALFVAESGNIGLGTSLPEAQIHIVTGFVGAGVTMEKTAGTAGKWRMDVGSTGLVFTDLLSNHSALVVENGAPESALWVADDGDVGLGTATPDAPLELNSSGSFNFFRITAAGAAVNESVDFVFTNGPMGTGQLRYNIVEAGDAPQVPEMTLDADGNMTLTGMLTTSGPTCAGGCDRVFDADYALPSIADHATQMFSAGHLPSVSPTRPGQPMNVTEQMGGMLNALEHAHIFIAQQNDLIAQLQDEKQAFEERTAQNQAATTAQIAALAARLAAIE